MSFTRFILRLFEMEKTPPEPFQGEVQGVKYHVDSLSKGDVVIWIDLPRDQMNAEPYMIKRQNPFQGQSAPVFFLSQPLWTMGAQSIDIGNSDDKIQITIPAYLIQVDQDYAEQAVALMIQIRCEILGEKQSIVIQRPWKEESEVTLDFDGQEVIFKFSSCLAYTEEDLKGNLEVMVKTEPSLPAPELSDNLCVGIPGIEELVTSDAYGEEDNAALISFGLMNSGIGFDQEVKSTLFKINEIEIFWGNNRDILVTKVSLEFASEDI